MGIINTKKQTKTLSKKLSKSPISRQENLRGIIANPVNYQYLKGGEFPPFISHIFTYPYGRSRRAVGYCYTAKGRIFGITKELSRFVGVSSYRKQTKNSRAIVGFSIDQRFAENSSYDAIGIIPNILAFRKSTAVGGAALYTGFRGFGDEVHRISLSNLRPDMMLEIIDQQERTEKAYSRNILLNGISIVEDVPSAGLLSRLQEQVPTSINVASFNLGVTGFLTLDFECMPHTAISLDFGSKIEYYNLRKNTSQRQIKTR